MLTPAAYWCSADSQKVDINKKKMATATLKGNIPNYH